MKYFNLFLALVLLVSGFLPAQAADWGTLDHNKVQLLADGTAKSIEILSLNDFHGALYEDVTPVTGKNPGAPKLAAYIDLFRAAYPNTLVVAAGDNYQGTALSVLTKGRVVSEFFHRIGIAASAVGNHEFDWGDGNFPGWTHDGGFPFLAANILDKVTGKVPGWALPYTLDRVGGHLVAFIGLSTLDTLHSAKADNLAAYRFEKPAEAARFWVNYLNATYRPEVIVALTHLPTKMDPFQKDLVLSANDDQEIEDLCHIQGLDAVITGHSHQTVSGKCWGVPVVQGYYNGRSLGHLTVTFREDGSKNVTSQVDEVYKKKGDLSEDPESRTLVEDYAAKYGTTLTELVATAPAALVHDDRNNVSPMGRWVCEVLRQRFGVQVAFTNGGGLRKGFNPGPVLVQDFWELMPFDNTGVTFSVTGANLKKIIDHGLDSRNFGNGQFSGLRVRYNPGLPQGSKILSMELEDGTPVEDTKVYTAVTNDFVFSGGDYYTMVKPSALDPVDTYVLLRDVLVEAARKAGTLTVPKVESLQVQTK